MGKIILSQNLVHMKFDIFSTTYKKIAEILFFVWFLALLKAGYPEKQYSYMLDIM